VQKERDMNLTCKITPRPIRTCACDLVFGPELKYLLAGISADQPSVLLVVIVFRLLGMFPLRRTVFVAAAD
jgi:hypothetical protein